MKVMTVTVWGGAGGSHHESAHPLPPGRGHGPTAMPPTFLLVLEGLRETFLSESSGLYAVMVTNSSHISLFFSGGGGGICADAFLSRILPRT